MVFDVFERLDQIAHMLPPERWLLVGGLMVHAHARLAGVPHGRPTDDADLVVEVRAGSYSEAARASKSWVTSGMSHWTIALPSTGSPAATTRWT